MKRLLITLVALGVLLVAADLGVRWIAERQLASTLQSRLGLASDPDVSIGGFSVLYQAVTGTYDEVTVTATDVPTDNIGTLDYYLELHDIDLPISKVISRDVDGVVAGSAHAEIRVPQAALSDLAGRDVQVAKAENGAIVLTTTYEIAGTQIDLTVTASVQVDAESVTINVQEVQAAGVTVPSSVVSGLSDALDISFPLPAAIRGLTLSGVRAADGAIVLDAEGTDVPLGEQ